LKRNNIEIIVSIMELYELKYFLGVARFENIHRAAEKLNVSTGSLSKAIGRLEDELSVKLFVRERRNIKLTDQGRVLQKKAAEMVQLEESLRLEVAGHPGIFIAKFGTELVSKIKKTFPASRFEFQACSEDRALTKVDRGEAHFAVISGDLGTFSDLDSKILAEAEFLTYVGAGHPLHAKATAKKTVPVEQVLQFSFVSPDNPLLGKVGAKQSLDGWRDDKFPRKVDYLTSSLKILEELVVSGAAIGYLPSYFCENLNLDVLKIGGCPYSCTQKIKLIAKNSKATGWLNQIFN
jgi:DNA-binding transcriptional LysR family regulator